MPDRTVTVTLELTFRPRAGEDIERLKMYAVKTAEGMPRIAGIRIADVTEGSERTWDDDCAAAEALDRDDNRPITEEEIARGYGVDLNGFASERDVPAKLGHVARRWPQ